MKQTIININAMSDSKEVYGQRPNPFISWFIYCLVALLAAALIYSFVGKIEIVAKATGVVRPNDDVSTVSSLNGGRITGVFYADGQLVKEGDPLLTIDTSELEISLDSMNDTREEYEAKLSMLDKFLDGIKTGANPFSQDEESGEFPYYIQYRDYELLNKNSKEKFEYDAETAAANISAANQRIWEIGQQLAGLSAYRTSIQDGSDQAAAYPEYERMYQLYSAEIDALKSDYEAKKAQIELDQSWESNQYYLDYYEKTIADYEYLLNSIRNNRSMFPQNYSGNCVLLWNNYRSCMSEYERKYTAAVDIYDLYLYSANPGGSVDDILAYDLTMLEGYQFFQQSVINDTDMFDAGKNSVYYRKLYSDYEAQYTTLTQAIQTAENQYLLAVSDPSLTEDEVNSVLAVKEDAESARDTYKSNTLATISNTILQIQASIAEKELGLNSTASEYNISTAKAQMESADAASLAYKDQTLAEYEQALSDYKTKLQELRFSADSTLAKETVLSNLETTFNNTIEQKCYQTLTQIDNAIQTLESERSSVQSNLRLYQIANDMYQSSVDEDGVPLNVSLAFMEQISSLLTQQETLSSQLHELDVQIQQAEEKISHGSVLAERSGIVSVTSTLVAGDNIAAGTQFATIIPPSESEYKVQLYVSNSDIAGITVGDEVKFNLAALPSNQYGLITGEVTDISTDTVIQNGQYSGYYMVECSIANTVLTDKDGNSGSVVIGMQAEAKIVTQEKTIIRYLLEKINLF